MCLYRNCVAIGDAMKVSACISPSCTQNAILSLIIMHIVPSCQISVAVNNPLLDPSISCLLLVAISGILCAQPTMLPMLKLCKAMADGASHTYTNFEM